MATMVTWSVTEIRTVANFFVFVYVYFFICTCHFLFSPSHFDFMYQLWEVNLVKNFIDRQQNIQRDCD